MLRTGVDRSDGGVVVDRLRMHRFDQADIIGNGGGVGNDLAKPGAVLPMLAEFEHRSHAGERRLFGSHPGDALAVADAVGQFLPVVFA